jgi:hypothetical protein
MLSEIFIEDALVNSTHIHHGMRRAATSDCLELQTTLCFRIHHVGLASRVLC